MATLESPGDGLSGAVAPLKAGRPTEHPETSASTKPLPRTTAAKARTLANR